MGWEDDDEDVVKLLAIVILKYWTRREDIVESEERCKDVM